MNTFQIEYFAVLREHAGCAAEEYASRAATPAELYAELEERFAIPAIGTVRVAINDEFSDWDAALADGDRVVFIPPVAGG